MEYIPVVKPNDNNDNNIIDMVSILGYNSNNNNDNDFKIKIK